MNMMIAAKKKLLMAQKTGLSLNLDDAADFDGTNDYLIRSTDLVGNASGRTFTLSAWVNLDILSNNCAFYSTSTDGLSANYRLALRQAGSTLILQARSGVGSSILSATIAANLSVGAWTHVVASLDMNSASNRAVYINDAAASVTWATYSVGGNMGLANPYHLIGAQGTDAVRLDGKLAHVYYDKTYRDLSVVSNRRLFNDGAGKPAAGQADLAPIMYLPLVRSNPWSENLGTGGDFTVNGDMT